MYRDASNTNRTRYNTKRGQENYIHWKYSKSHGRKSA